MNNTSPAAPRPSGFFDPQKVDWNLLKSFQRVADAGSLTRAAAALGISQPTLSRHIAELEQQIGAALFERAARGLRLTAAGAALVEPASRMLAAAQALGMAAAGHNQTLAGTVRLTASEIMSAYVLPPILVRLRQRYPDIQVELVASNHVDNLLAREADIALRMVQPEQGGLIAKKIGSFPLGFYVHRDYLAQRGAVLQPDTWRQHDWIGLDQSQQMLDGFRQAGFAVEKNFFSFRCDNQIVAWQAVVAGLGIGISMQQVARQFPQLVRVLAHQPLPELPVWLTAHRELRDSLRMRAVFDFLSQALVMDETAAMPTRQTQAT